MPDVGAWLNLDFVRSKAGRWSIAAAVVGVVALAALWFVVPAMAESRAQKRLDGLGLRWSSQGRALGLRGIRFAHVAIADVGTGRELVHLSSLEVDVAWLRALREPREAVERVHVMGAKADLHIDDVRRMRRGRGSAPPAEEGSDGAPLPQIMIENVGLTLRDDEGEMVKGHLDRLDVSSGGWELALAQVDVGGGSGETAALQRVRASGPREGRRVQLARASVDAATLVWTRARSGVDAPGAGPRSLGIIRRIGKWREAASRPGEPGRLVPSETTKAKPWTADAKLELRSTRVMDGSTSPPRVILDKLSVTLLAQGSSTVRVKGDGETETGGSLLWDLHVTPEDAEVEGRVSLRAVPLALFTPVLPKLPFHALERTRVEANVAITGRGLESASVRGELSISELAFASERLAREPVGPISFTARGQGTWTPARRELSGLRGEVVSGETRLLATGALAWPADAYRIDLRLELPQTKCQAVLDVVPSGVLDELASVQLRGDMRAKLDVHVDSANLDATKLDFDINDKCRFASLPPAMSVRRFERRFTHRALEPDGTMFEMDTGPGMPAWTPIELISPFMVQAVVAHEDGRFFGHRGFAEVEIGAALARNLKAKAFKFGASTITMQLVKNVFLQRDKLLSRKVQEALIVWWLEQQVDKKWILELYLNVIEYGTSVYGIRNASLHYFGVLPIHLTPAQSAFLATILPSPKAYDEQYARGTLSESTKVRVAKFLQHMRSRDRIDDEALAYGLEELQQFRFYDPDQPPPVPPPPRGSAQAPPFQMGAVDGWNMFDPATKAEDGSFGVGL